MRILMVLSILALAGCATVDGIGQDISTGARKVQAAF